ncbi:MAG: Ldh family oxidoreductase [Alphaproteobacteria bacterium]|nr:Ldh family oxidoreductase [Alphaproteobacteria bacterium]
MTTISITELEALCLDVLLSAGVRESDARITVDHYLENELSGKASHGMVRVVEAAKALQKYGVPSQNPEIETDKGNMAVLNAKRQLAPVAGMAAVDLAIERAKTHGLVMVGVRDYIASSGSMAYYLRRLAAAGLIAIMGCNSVAMVAPPGGRERRVGTNPVGIAIPADNTEMIADFGTGAIAYGKIMVMNDKGERVPEGKMIDSAGNPSTNPKDAYDGAILPMEEYKGFALGLMVELLAGPLIGAKAIKQNLYDNDGLFILAIDPSYMGHENYKFAISKAFEEVIETPLRPEYETITLPGARSAQHLQAARESGVIDIADKTLNDLYALSSQRGAA